MNKMLVSSEKGCTFAPAKQSNMPACHAGGREFESRPDRKERKSKRPALFCLRYNRLRLSLVNFKRTSKRKKPFM